MIVWDLRSGRTKHACTRPRGSQILTILLMDEILHQLGLATPISTPLSPCFHIVRPLLTPGLNIAWGGHDMRGAANIKTGGQKGGLGGVRVLVVTGLGCHGLVWLRVLVVTVLGSYGSG